MEIVINLDKEDWKRFNLFLGKELPKRKLAGGKDSWVKFSALLSLILSGFVLRHIIDHFHWPTAKAVSVFFIFVLLFVVLICQMNQKAYEPGEDGTFVGEHRFVFDEKGIDSKSRGCEGRTMWSVVKNIVRAEDMILIFLDTTIAFVFPEKKLDNPDEFYKYVTEQYSKVKPI